MADAGPFKLAFIGSHGVGKTTLCFGLAARLKSRDLLLDVVHEVARRCPLPLNEETSVDAQTWIAHTQIAEEVAAGATFPISICDRSVLDNYAYLELAHGKIDALERMVRDWIATYQLLFLVPVLHAPQPDGTRAVSEAFQSQVEAKLWDLVHRFEVPVEDLSSVPRAQWLDHVETIVLDRLAPPQLELL